MPKRTFKKSNRKQTGSGGCFSTVEDLRDIDTSLKNISMKFKDIKNDDIKNDQELEAALEEEYKKITAKIESSTNNNNNNNRSLSNNNNQSVNNNSIRQMLGMSDEEFAALDKEFAELIGKKPKSTSK